MIDVQLMIRGPPVTSRQIHGHFPANHPEQRFSFLHPPAFARFSRRVVHSFQPRSCFMIRNHAFVYDIDRAV